MNFINSYKTLEKLCNDIYGNIHGISSYINEMTDRPRGSYIVNGWDDDLKRLKHYRWIRNQIAHDPVCTEENMCESKDSEWLARFYSRIMEQTDPLAEYRKIINARSVAKASQRSQPSNSQYQPVKFQCQPFIPQYPPFVYQHRHSDRHQQSKKASHKYIGCIAFIITAFLIALTLFIYIFLTYF